MKSHILSKMRLSILVCLFCINHLSDANAVENKDYKFRTMSPKGGFYYDGVKNILQDKDGFIWILMDNILLRFDGYDYKRYYTHFRKSDTAQDFTLNQLSMDSSGRLYIGTGSGLFVYNKSIDDFEQIFDEAISFVYVDRADNIWIRNQSHISIFHSPDSIYTPLSNGKPISAVMAQTDSKDKLILASYTKVYSYTHATNQLTEILSYPSEYQITDIERNGDKLWILFRTKGLVRINLSTLKQEAHYDFFCTYDNHDVQVKGSHIDKYGMIWIATQLGIYILDPATGKYHLHQHSPTDPFSLPNNSVWSIAEDSRQNIWIGTFSGGLCMVNPDETYKFRTFNTQTSPLNHNMVSSFAESDTYLWVGTEGGGINQINKSTGEFTYILQSANNGLASNNIKSMIHDPKTANIWIAQYRGGLTKYNERTNTYTTFKYERSDKNSLISNNLRKIIPQGDEGIWIAYQVIQNAISFYSYKENRFTHHHFDKGEPASYIFDICLDSNNRLWIITAKKLYCMHPSDQSVSNIHLDSIPYLNARTLCADNEDNIWIGTIGNGLIQYRTSTRTYETYPEILDYDVSSIYSICADNENNLWMGTDNGLFRYNTVNGSYHRFDRNDNVQGDIYYPLSCAVGQSGDIYMGGTNGFTIINPRNMKFNNQKPNVVISDFTIDNVSVAPPFDKLNKEIKLTYTQQNFGFVFSSDSYMSPRKAMYRYRLRGYEDRWITVNAQNRTALYSKVPPGTYHLEVAAANNDGLWGDPTVIRIIRKPSPWMSWLAYCVYTIILMSILCTILYYYYEKRKLKYRLYLDKLDKEKKEEIHQSQLRFFTNISHDFRTPLSLILSALQNLQKEGLNNNYFRILNSNAQRLLNLINELMDFRTVENGKMKLQVQLTDINRVVNDITTDFIVHAREKNIDFRVNCDQAMSTLTYIDRAVVEKILMNLLNNAIKYTPANGSILVETYSDPSRFQPRYVNSHVIGTGNTQGKSFLIAVRDTGVGISAESIACVFERFYKVKTENQDNHIGTGIGLALVKSLALLHKGIITIFSERGKGTDILVALPAETSAYLSNEVITIPDEISDDEQSEVPETNEKKSMLLDAKKRILIVEDNNDLRVMTANFLSEHYRIIQAADGLIASDYLKDNEIDLIICDIMMPYKDGITLCAEVKNDIATSHIPFILLTAKTDIASKLDGTGSGANLYLEKPVDLNLLSLTIENIFEQQNKLRSYYAKHFYADGTEAASNERDNIFLKELIEIIDKNLSEPVIDVNFIASSLSMSRSKLYSKIKALTGRSIVEFMLDYRLRKAARMMIEENISLQQVMDNIGIKSQSYFTRVFKNEFGETPSAFARKHRKKQSEN